MSSPHFYSICIGFLLGIAVGTGVNVSWEVVLLGILLATTALVYSRSKQALFCAGIGFIAFSLGLSLGIYEVKKERVLVSLIGTEVSRSGVIAHDPDVRALGQVLTVLDDESEELVLLRERDHEDRYIGDRITYSGKLELPEVFDTEEARVFDYPKFLLARDICCVVEKAQIEIESRGEEYKLEATLLSFKYAIAHSLERVMAEPEVSLSKAMLLGMKRELDKNENRVFKNVGIVHVVVLSGMHIMFLFFFTARIAAFLSGQRVRYLIALVFVFLFALMVGFEPTVTRAVVMATFVGAAFLFGRDRVSMRSLLFAAVIMLIYNPYMLVYDPGFQLSFLATFAIIVVAPIFMEIFHKVPETLGFREIIAVTIGIECLLLPLIAYSMGQFPLIGVVANILVLPVVVLAIVSSAYLALIGIVLPSLAFMLAPPVALVHTYILETAAFLERIPYTHYRMPEFSFATLLLVYLCIGIVLYFLHRRYVGMPHVQKSAHEGVDVRSYTIVPLRDFMKDFSGSYLGEPRGRSS